MAVETAGAEQHAAYWFGQGAAFAEQLDGSASNSGELPAPPHEQVVAFLEEAGGPQGTARQLRAPSSAWAMVGGRGLLAQHRTYLGRLQAPAAPAFAGVGLARAHADPSDDLAIIRRSYAPAFADSYRLGRSIDLSREAGCARLETLPEEALRRSAEAYPALDRVRIRLAPPGDPQGQPARAPRTDDVLLAPEAACGGADHRPWSGGTEPRADPGRCRSAALPALRERPRCGA